MGTASLCVLGNCSPPARTNPLQSVETSSKEEGGMRKGVEGEKKKRNWMENKANKENTRFPGGVKTCISEKSGGKALRSESGPSPPVSY